MKYFIGTLFALLFLVISTGPGGRVKPSEAAAGQLFFSDTCSSSGSNGTFSWQGNDPNAVQQWLDISLFDNGWQDGTFISAGPFNGSTTSFTWSGLLPGTLHFVRVNQQFADGTWDPSPTFQITTGCGAPAVSSPPSSPADEGTYRDRANAQLAYLAASLDQWINSPPNRIGDIPDYISRGASIAQNFASAMDNLAPIPPRFVKVHNNLRTAMDAFGQQVKAGLTITTLNQFYAWADKLLALADQATAAINDFNLVVGTSVPGLK